MNGLPPPGHTSDSGNPASWSSARRRWLFGAVAGAATLAGAGIAWWQGRPGSATGPAPAPLWSMVFPTPDGNSLAMQNFSGKPLLLNFWATWCPPCVEEMPLLDRFHDENKINGWQVVGIAVDQGATVQRFLQQTPVRFPIALAGMSGVELSRSLGNLSGGLPFTVVLNSAGLIAQRKMGRVSPQDLQQWRSLR